jgi:hypothetical protein
MMKKVYLKYLLAGAFTLLPPIGQAQELKPWQDIALELVRNEARVLDAMWSQSISFWVAMADNGSRRDGYAEYICFILADAGMPDGTFVSISIWDAATMNSNKLKKLGQANCS